ncbi:MAG: 5-oxoprolinase subunit PxpA [Gluconobacter potus]|uniref:5-oxoprolinase subunit A n=1 Tax=Gluconobacter potus TaxID=2724927 RepID=A0ABR9YNB6_9PROT|nr:MULTISPECIES: 5-oxoprolinase subunit PxpA [Gluconobacter]MBF0851111.1 LamB/YcsF family protein [Gluconobacter sp. R75690]MBF0865172.1 LamB/YcsF family protein [Gluconobacter sp. R71656]MBF0868318.1 LamB/YcsF family protein [Gluconobacter sp. R75628]MBF0874310.1 LamB/YcsF family protein [Gluconobacter sp. R75629]MBF0879803.1 LamB/YcsF family protein [Gluconobacter sp. R75828]
MKIDLNSDMGEGFGRWRIADDDGLMDVISSANIACGFHAGDYAIMNRTVQLAKEKGVGIGAHPGLPDLMGFGRRSMSISDADMEAMMVYQIGALQAVAALHGHRVTHVSYHAAFGNMANADEGLALRLARAIAALDRELTVFCMPGQLTERAADKAGIRAQTLFLADRAYTSLGTLVPRGQPGAVIHDLDAVRARVRQFLEDGSVTTSVGSRLEVKAQSILVHSDTPGSLELAKAIRSEIEATGATLTPAFQLPD